MSNSSRRQLQQEQSKPPSMIDETGQQQTQYGQSYYKHKSSLLLEQKRPVSRNNKDTVATTSNPTTTTTSSTSSAWVWSITDYGQMGEYSRDGSSHVTDEVFNAASHLAGFILSILGTVLLVVESSTQHNVWKIVTFSIYGTSLILLFGCSTMHHAITGSWESTFRILDYLAIFPLIAGTFTPLCLVFYHNRPIGWAFCMTVWGIAVLSMIQMACCFDKIPKWMSMTCYVTLGWFGVCFSYWLVPVLGWDGYSLFVLGGVFYTIGGWVYTTEQPNPIPFQFGFHEIWHCAVLAGAATHWLLMYCYVLPVR